MINTSYGGSGSSQGSNSARTGNAHGGGLPLNHAYNKSLASSLIAHKTTAELAEELQNLGAQGRLDAARRANVLPEELHKDRFLAERLEIAGKLLDKGVAIDIIAFSTGLSPAQVESLREQANPFS